MSRSFVLSMQRIRFHTRCLRSKDIRFNARRTPAAGDRITQRGYHLLATLIAELFGTTTGKLTMETDCNHFLSPASLLLAVVAACGNG